MKYTIVIVLLFATLSSCVHTVNFSETKNHIQVYEDTPGSKEELFTKASAWMTTLTISNSETAVQHSDAYQGVIISKYLMYGRRALTAAGVVDNRVFSTLEIRVLENKARIEIKPQPHWEYDPHGLSEHKYGEIDAVFDMRKLAESFHQALLKKSVQF